MKHLITASTYIRTLLRDIFVTFRLTMAVLTLLMVSLSFTTLSDPWVLLMRGGLPARIFSVALAFFAMTAIIDAMIFDGYGKAPKGDEPDMRSMSEKLASMLRRRRGLGWMIIAICYMEQMAVVWADGMAIQLGLVYLIEALACIAIACETYRRLCARTQRTVDSVNGTLGPR